MVQPAASTHRATPAVAPLLRDQLCFALYSASLQMTKAYKPLLAAIGLTYPQYITLLALWERDGQRVSELADQLCLDSGTLTPLLRRMETAGWLNRRRSLADQREVHVWLASSGRSLRTQASGLHHRIACATACSATQLDALTKQLVALRTQLAEPVASLTTTVGESPA